MINTDFGGNFPSSAPSGTSNLTNGAGANVIAKSDGTNLVASSLTDNGTTVSTTEAFSAAALTSTGTTVLGDSTHDTSTGRDLAVGRNETVAGTLGVTGATTVSTLHATGAVTMDAAATVGTTLGVTGATTLSSTLSAQGTTVTTLHATGAATMDSTLSAVGITNTGPQIESDQINPTGLTGSINDWAPTSFASAKYILCSASGSTTITGIAGGVDGRVIVLIGDPNNSAGNSVTFSHESASSAAANRITGVNSGSPILGAASFSTLTLRYDGTAQRWRMVGDCPNQIGRGVNFNAGCVFASTAQYSSVTTPSALPSTQNDYGPTGAQSYRITPASGGTTLSGVSTGVVSGRVMWLFNISTTDTLTLTHDSTSTAANRFFLPNSASLAIRPNGAAQFWYDATSSRWRCIASAA